MADSSSWWVLIPAVDKGESASQLEQVDFRTTGLTAAQIKTLQSGGQISDYGMEMVLWKGPFATEAEAQAAQNPQPGPNSPVKALQDTAKNAISSVTGISSITDFLSSTSVWVRIGQVAVGLILLAVGIARITHAVPIATSVAKKVGAVALV